MIREAESLAPQSPFSGQGIGRPFGTDSRWRELDARLPSECRVSRRPVAAPYRQPAIRLSYVWSLAKLLASVVLFRLRDRTGFVMLSIGRRPRHDSRR